MRTDQGPAPARRRRIGVIGTFVWDVIHGRDARAVPIEEWGGITYSLSGLDAALPDDWEIVPIMKVGEDLAARAREFLRSLRRIAPDAALVEVPYPGHRVELRYYDDERRTEVLTGGIPAWSWLALKPLLDGARLDALYINFLSGWELDLETAQLVRRHFDFPIHCDLHMLAMAVQPDGLRTPRPIPHRGGVVRLLRLPADERGGAGDGRAGFDEPRGDGARGGGVVPAGDAGQAGRGVRRRAGIRHHM